jgi:hypothetical protein
LGRRLVAVKSGYPLDFGFPSDFPVHIDRQRRQQIEQGLRQLDAVGFDGSHNMSLHGGATRHSAQVFFSIDKDFENPFRGQSQLRRRSYG